MRNSFHPWAGGSALVLEAVVDEPRQEISASLREKPSFFEGEFPRIEDLARDLAQRGNPKISEQNLKFLWRKISRKLHEISEKNKFNQSAVVWEVLRDFDAGGFVHSSLDLNDGQEKAVWSFLETLTNKI